MCANKWSLARWRCFLLTIRLQILYIHYVFKQDLALNSLEGFIYHKYNKPTNQPTLNSLKY